MAKLSAFLNVHDLARSIGFYQNIGFLPTYLRQNDKGQPIYGGVEMDGVELEFGWIGSNPDKEYQSWVGTPLGAGLVLYVSVDDVDKVAKAARQMGATIEYGPEDRSYGRVLGINDPDGYVVTFIEEPKARKTTSRPKKSAKKALKKAAKKGGKKASKKR